LESELNAEREAN